MVYVQAVNHVVVFGAGFSRAIGQSMPLTDELGMRAAQRLRADRGSSPRTPPGLSFESWLSLLADDQPQLSEAENRGNAALFARLRDAITTEILAAQTDALRCSAPAWLYELLRVLHIERATVLTLNYDTLVEAALTDRWLWEPKFGGFVEPIDVLRNLPPRPQSLDYAAEDAGESFWLLKLHGSIDWWSVPNDESGATLLREEARNVFGDPHQLSDDERQRRLPGRERFVIPPLSGKSSYYRNPLTRELWRQAHRALRSADRISLVGYSLPATDLVITNMVRVALEDREVEVDVVNPEPNDLVGQLSRLGVDEDHLHVMSGLDCVASFSESLRDQTARALATRLQRADLEIEPSADLAVAWGHPGAGAPTVRRVVTLSSGSQSSLELVLERDPPPGDATASRLASEFTTPQRKFLQAAEFAQAVRSSDRLVARLDDKTYPLVAAWPEGRPTGANHHWLFFAPAGRWQEETRGP